MRRPQQGCPPGKPLALLAEHGPNRIPTETSVPAWRRFLAEFTHPAQTIAGTPSSRLTNAAGLLGPHLSVKTIVHRRPSLQ